MDDVDVKSNGYGTAESLIDKMNDETSPLRLLVFVGKGGIGIDILTVCHTMSLRTYKSSVVVSDNSDDQKKNEKEKKKEVKYIVHRGKQELGRPRRLVLYVELLLPYFKDNVDGLITYYKAVNSYTSYLPDAPWWHEAQKQIDEELPSMHEIEMYIRKRWDETYNQQDLT